MYSPPDVVDSAPQGCLLVRPFVPGGAGESVVASELAAVLGFAFIAASLNGTDGSVWLVPQPPKVTSDKLDIDTTVLPPTKSLVAPTLSLVADTGIAGDGITNNSAVSVTGLELGATWEYAVDGGAFTAGTGSGFTLTAGSHTYSVRQTDKANNQSPASTAVTYELDTLAPTAPTAVTATPSGGEVQADILNAGNTAMTFDATIIAGEAVGGNAEFYVNGTLIGTDASIGATDTQVSYTTSDGTPTSAEVQAAITAGGVVTVKLYDRANNEVTGTGNTLTRDLSISAAPTGPHTIALSQDTGASGTDLITSVANQTALSLTLGAALSLAADEALQVSVDGGTNWIDLSGAGTAWSAAVTLLGGTHPLQVRIHDTSGNSTDLSADLSPASSSYTLDTLAPTATLTAATGPSSASATGQSSELGTAYLLSTAYDAITFTNVADITAKADEQWNSAPIDNASTNTLLPLAGLNNGAYRLYVVDTAGNIGKSTNTYQVDTLQAPGMSLANDSGSLDSDRITKYATINVSGIRAGATWEYNVDGAGTWIAGSGSSFNALGGTHTYAVRQTLSGYTTPASGGLEVTLDTELTYSFGEFTNLITEVGTYVASGGPTEVTDLAGNSRYFEVDTYTMREYHRWGTMTRNDEEPAKYGTTYQADGRSFISAQDALVKAIASVDSTGTWYLNFVDGPYASSAIVPTWLDALI